MANIVITSTTNAVKLDFGVTSNVFGFGKRIIQKASAELGISDDNKMVTLDTIRGNYCFSYNEVNGAQIVDTVGGVAPTDNPDLFTKLSALIE